MSLLWTYFWPVIAIGFAAGLIGGLVALRRRSWLAAAAALLVTLAGVGLWHGPIGGAERFSTNVERSARVRLVDWEMGHIQSNLPDRPLTRRLQLSGQADDFQRTELVRIMSDIPGVSGATWQGSAGVPLIIEAAGASILGFILGLLLAYGIERRRRYNAQWRW